MLAASPARGLIVTAIGDGRADFVSRCFFPRYGVPEDPVTGSAHCMLGGYWSSRLDRNDLLGEQASARGGFVGVSVDGDRIRLSGRANTVLTGTLSL